MVLEGALSEMIMGLMSWLKTKFQSETKPARTLTDLT
jgi:hypothetical protein